ncbi:MAG: carbohydrate ABC transporter permease [Caldilinea sp. CFX5]|nr:carbohydrate ABC transporter permease [Caldilinea sp. CFX5]
MTIDATLGEVERKQPALRRFVVFGLLVVGSLIYAFPFFWMISTSLKIPENIYLDPPQWIPDPVAWENYVRIFDIGPVWSWIWNSTLITALTVILRTISSVVVAYGFARFAFPGSRALFILLLSSLMLPGHVTIIPRFLMFRDWQWLDTYWPLIAPNLFSTAFSVFLIRQFLMTLPRELDEAAEIDGATTWDILWRLLVPLSKPAIATVAVFTFIDAWNDFFEPFIFLSTPTRLTLAVGIRWFRTQYETQFHLMMAISVVAVLPIIVAFLFTQKYFIRGIALTGLKG